MTRQRVPTMAIIRDVRAQLRRRLLISYRLEPTVAASLLPDGFRPQIVDGSAIAGICILGLESIRPSWAQRRWGLRSENAAHRMAVEWDGPDGPEQGVFIFERHSSAWHPVLFGGRLFPGVHRKAQFRTEEAGDRYAVSMAAAGNSLDADVEVVDEWSSGIFASVQEASDFYRAGRVGWSRTHDGRGVESVALATDAWKVEAGRALALRSSFFDALPEGSAEFDSVVIMRDLPLMLSDAGARLRLRDEDLPAARR